MNDRAKNSDNQRFARLIDKNEQQQQQQQQLQQKQQTSLLKPAHKSKILSSIMNSIRQVISTFASLYQLYPPPPL